MPAASLTTIKEYIDKALKILTPKNEPISIAGNEQNKQLIILLRSLRDAVKSLREDPGVYQTVLDFGVMIRELYIGHLPVNHNTELTKLVKHLLEGIELFNTYHRNRSVIANNKFLEEIHNHLRDNHKIITSDCDVIEETLLHLAGAVLGPNGKSKVEKGYDSSRLVFSLTDINKENTEKVLALLHSKGDKTAMEGYGHQSYAHAIPEAAFMSFESTSKSLMTRKVAKRTLERHSIETDGEFFYTVMFPLLKEAVQAMELTKPDVLKVYRDKSHATLEMIEEEKKATAAANSSVIPNNLFQPIAMNDLLNANVPQSSADDDSSMQLFM